jgi:hypothetical protein
MYTSSVAGFGALAEALSEQSLSEMVQSQAPSSPIIQIITAHAQYPMKQA